MDWFSWAIKSAMEKAMKGHGQWKFSLQVSTPFYDIYFLYIPIWENYFPQKKENVLIFF